MLSPAACPAIVSPPQYTCLSTPSLLRHYPASSVLWIDPTTYDSSPGLVSSASGTPFKEEDTGPPRFLRNPFGSMPWTVPRCSFHHLAYNDGLVAGFGVLNHLGLLHNISVFEAEHLHPCGLRNTSNLFTLHPHDYPHRCKTRF